MCYNLKLLIFCFGEEVVMLKFYLIWWIKILNNGIIFELNYSEWYFEFLIFCDFKVIVGELLCCNWLFVNIIEFVLFIIKVNLFFFIVNCLNVVKNVVRNVKFVILFFIVGF